MKTLIQNGHLIDPANGVDAWLNLLIEDSRIVWVGQTQPDADRIIDASGLVVCPGFIDLHMHEDPVGPDGRIACSILNSMLRMGVTTVLGGNCGMNVCDPADYLDLADRDGAPVNIAMLAGHEYFRMAAGAADKYAPATEVQKQRMVEGITAALSRGCMGVSFGLRYIPGADRDEFYRAAACCKPGHHLITAHVRDDADAIFSAIDEMAGAALAYGLPLQISHIGSMGGFGQMAQVLRQTDAYRLNGLDVMLDCYPYCAFSTMIGATTYDDGWLERYHCDYSVLEFSTGKYRGQRATPETFAEMRAADPDALTVCHVMRPGDIDLALRHPGVILASDGLTSNGLGHPRAAGTFPRLIAEYVRKGKLDLYTAIAKMTSMPAQRLHLSGKGRLNAGADADLVIFDPDRIRDRATFAEPALAPEGIHSVWIGGQLAAQDCRILNAACGRAVRA